MSNQIAGKVNPNELLAKPHVTNGRCWCKARVPLMVDGVKVGEGTIDHTGLFTASVSSDILAQKFTEGIVENLSIGTKFKDPEAAVETVNLSRSF